jgi:hypothetical protein
MARYPDSIAGFVNLDGFPHPFHVYRQHFLGTSRVYTFASGMTWTGVLRLPMYAASRSMFPEVASKFFPVAAVSAEMNRAQFWSNTKKEFVLMMDLAKDASDAWGPASITALDDAVVDALERAEPTENGDWDGQGWTAMARGTSEPGTAWADPQATASVVNRHLRTAAGATALGRRWMQIPVAVLSARSYAMMGGDRFYKPEMRRHAAAEHAAHHLLGLPGSVRYVFPHIAHDKLFLRTDAVALCARTVHQVAQSNVDRDAK